MPDGDDGLFTVTDLKQYQYCARILYYHACLPDVRPVTRKMELGIRRHETESRRAIRRTMRIEGIEEARRVFDVAVQSQKLGLSGQIDEIIFFADHLIPVDYKLAKKVGAHFRLQIAAYAMLAEEQFGLKVRQGICYLIHSRDAVEIPITHRLRNNVVEAVEQMRRIVDKESMPEPTKQPRACMDCEFRRFCNDV